MLFQGRISHIQFRKWLWQDNENRLLLKLSAVAISLSFGWLKLLYPYPNFMPPDSYSYLEAAYDNEFVNMWAIGYSRFLRLVSSFSNSHFALVTIQYLFLQSGILYFLFSIRYLFAPGKWLFRIILVLTVLNPLVVHIANFVSSDCLFTALSLVWFTQLLWIICYPSRKLLLTHAIVLLLAFMVRYNSLYFPFISVTVILYKNIPKSMKYFGVGSVVILLFIFIGSTQYEYHKRTGTVQYSAFGGWQMAANALYGYAHAKLDDLNSVPKKFRPLHKVVNRHMDSIQHLAMRPDEEVGVYYLWDFKSPLRVYMDSIWGEDTTEPFFKKWAIMAPLYAAYGRYMIWKHPWSYFKYYVWPNFKRYYAPPAQFMGKYNLSNETVDPIAVKWFKWKSNKLPLNAKDRQIKIANVFTILNPIINIVFVAGLFGFVALGGYRTCRPVNSRILTCTLAIWLLNMMFSVLAAPIELRYQLFPFLMTFAMDALFLGYIIQKTGLIPKLHEIGDKSIATEVLL